MKKIIVAALGLVTILTTVAFTTIIKKSEAVSYAVDTKNSKVEWSGSKKSGYHTGYFMLKDGNINVSEGKIVGGNFNIDVAGIKLTDGAGEKFENHLKSADFFDATNFPDANFEISSVKYTDANTAQIVGNLTLRGTKSEVKFDAKIRNVSETRVFAEAFFSLDRTIFGINYDKNKVATDVMIIVRLYASK